MLIKRSESLPLFPRLFGDFFDKEFSDWSNSNYSLTNTTLPATNIQEKSDEYIVTMAVPGMNKKDFKLDLTDNILTISSEKQEEKEEKDSNYTRKEYSYLSFARSFTIPQNVVDSNKISASYENGELQITIPKKEEAKAKKPVQIEIK